VSTKPPAVTLLWHDYETFGADPSLDYPAQFAAVRTDLNFRPLGEPISLFCQPPPDYLPHPVACLITGITPQYCHQHGLPENEFAARVHGELAAANTTAIGYNSMRFDEEFTRQLLWRNFYPAYAREHQHGNARFDMIDVFRMAFALRPGGVHWPSVDGKASFKLDVLAPANGVLPERAHDALSDVETLIALSAKLRAAQPRLWDYAFGLRRKLAVQAMIDFTDDEPLVHVSQRFGAERGCLALWLPICAHPAHGNEIIGVDLAGTIEPLLQLRSDEIAERLFVRQVDLPEGESRVLIKTLHLNRAPMLAKLATLRGADLRTVKLDASSDHPLEIQLERAKDLRADSSLANKIREVYAVQSVDRSAARLAADSGLYAGFLSDADSNLLARVRAAEPSAFTTLAERFQDPRIAQLLWRYQARNYPQSLSAPQRQRWQQECAKRLDDGAGMTRARFRAELDTARSHPLAAQQSALLDQLLNYEMQL
jgi:exodeoxyribonuclease I